jgi:PEP-CTERM motif-containing protein
MRKLVVCLTLALAGLRPALAAADPVRITDGSFRNMQDGEDYVLQGAAFAVRSLATGTMLFVDKTFDNPADCFWAQNRCAAGATLNPGFRTVSGDTDLGPASAMVNGQEYPELRLRGLLDFNVTPIVLPPTADGFLEVRSAFTFSGIVRGLDGSSEVFQRRLAGSGTVSIPFDVTGNTYFGEDNTIAFLFEDAAPVPEPGTIALLGAGVATLIARRRFRRRDV